MSRSRLVYYDDSDLSSGLKYSDGWFESFDSFSNDRGLVWKGTQHSTRSQASLSFSFVGTSFALTGRIEAVNRTTDGVILTPTWRCFVDGEPVENAMQNLPNRTAQVNNFGLCSKLGLSPGRHMLSVDAQASEQLPFWVDRISVRPIVEQPPENPTVQLQPLDEDFLYINGMWGGPENGDYRFTTHPGASVILDFHGTKVTWISEIPRGQPTGQSTGMYTLDDQEPVTFNISGQSSLGNRVLFETDTLAAGKHRLSVTYLGFSAPLALDRLVIEGGDIVALGGTSLDSPFGRNTITAPSQPNVGPIAGGVVGGIAGILALGALVWLFFKRRARRQQELAHVMDINGGTQPSGVGYKLSPFEGSLSVQQPSHAASVSGASAFSGSLDRTPSFQSSYLGPTREPFLTGNYVKGPGPQLPSTSYSNIPHDSAVSEKTRLAQKYARMDQGGMSSSTGSADASSSQVQLMQHNDSGVRLPDGTYTPGMVVEELPPSYTPA
ncbi:hypothetical protein FA15DRAFT_699778 [Coprinopsis marcescibilis]|uniref:Transmembrane protein n=1 Tax=Coprinopsis marcescibilis TaxID=230819 RepID=A0A5C3LCS1_COPMA|nr:hypothetical protein FA15DRAFT_699778 [Coprinopsis marcescibilis]